METSLASEMLRRAQAEDDKARQDTVGGMMYSICYARSWYMRCRDVAGGSGGPEGQAGPRAAADCRGDW